MTVLDAGRLDLGSALDFAIGNEEDAQLRYQEFAARVTDPRAASFFRGMIATEAEHRRQLEARRAVLFRHGSRRFDTSVADEGWLPDPDEVVTTISVREAMEVALAAEHRSHEFYAAALLAVKDPDVRALFEDLKQEEAEHEAVVRKMLGALPGAPACVEAENGARPPASPVLPLRR